MIRLSLSCKESRPHLSLGKQSPNDKNKRLVKTLKKKKKKQEKLWGITLCLISFAIVYPNYIVIFSPLFSNNSVSSPKNFCQVSLLEYLMLVFLCFPSILMFSLDKSNDVFEYSAKLVQKFWAVFVVGKLFACMIQCG